MGVNDLWSILNPVRESVPLYSLTGKTLAVDLSLWICEAQHVQGMMGKVTKPHLRNLFFRASSLLRTGIKLVFVMEGEAPKIKAETMSKRTEQLRGSKTKSAPKPGPSKYTSRGRFKAVLRECAEMLDYLGIPWVSAAGEAEAMCAFLDAQGLVDGCITSDGDAFLYGAQTVYRNFNMNTKDPQIDCYKMSRVETELQLLRETLVGLAVLLGCDYIPKGVPGVGKEQALKFIQNLKDTTLLQKFRDWRKSASDAQGFPVKKVTHCLVCRHPGSAKAHERSGCVFCGSEKFCEPQDYDSQCPCDWHRTEHARQAASVETFIKKKTLACDMFPFTEIISEFLVSKDKPVNSFKRRKPNLLLMQNFALDKMEWPKHYTSEKVLSLMTYTELMNRSQWTQSSTQIQPIRIHKRRIKNGVSCFEIVWRKPEHYVFPEDGPQDELDVVRTVEEENLFAVAFPDLVHLFHKETAEAKDNKLKKKKRKGEKEKPAVSSDGVADLFAQMSLKGSRPEPVESSEKGLQTTPGQSVPERCNTAPPSTLAERSDKIPSEVDLSSQLASPCHTGAFSPSQTSLSVSVVINELHLSSIDWDAQSFTAAPSPQAQHHKSDLPPPNRGCGTQSLSNAVQVDCAELCGISLMERLHLKNVRKCSGSGCNEEKEFASELKSTASLEEENLKVPPRTQGQKASGRITGLDSERTKESAHVPAPVPSLVLASVPAPARVADPVPVLAPARVADPAPVPARVADPAPVPAPARVADPVPVQAPPKYKFSKVKHFSRPSNDPSTGNVWKRSVCTKQVSSGDESDVENRTLTNQHQSKQETINKPQSSILLQKRITQDGCTKRVNSIHAHNKADSTTPNKQAHSTGPSRTNPLKPESKECTDSDDDDDDGSICSPLPLAERLKLKLNK